MYIFMCVCIYIYIVQHEAGFGQHPLGDKARTHTQCVANGIFDATSRDGTVQPMCILSLPTNTDVNEIWIHIPSGKVVKWDPSQAG